MSCVFPTEEIENAQIAKDGMNYQNGASKNIREKFKKEVSEQIEDLQGNNLG